MESEKFILKIYNNIIIMRIETKVFTTGQIYKSIFT